MALTYSQKRYIQDNYQKISSENIAKTLNISLDDVNNHIQKFYNNFNKKIKLSHNSHEALPEVIDISFQNWIKKHWINLLILLFFILIVYANGLMSDLVSDDIPAIVDIEKQLQSPSYLTLNPTFFPRAIQYFLAYKIGGVTPIYYRLFNIFFHIGTVWMVYAIVPFFSRKKLMPFLVASLVAVHPIMVESVTWISGGIYAQTAFSILISFYFYLKYRQSGSRRLILLSLFFYLLALTTSEKIIIYPGILFVYEFVFYNVWKTWPRILPYFVISFVWLLFIMTRVNDRIQYLEQIGSLDFGKNVYNPLEQIPTAVATYLELIFWPDKLTLYHSEFRLNLYQFFYLAGIFLVYVGVTIYTYFKNKTLFFWLTLFFITLIPTMNPLGLSWIAAERYVYLGSIGVYFFVAYFLAKLIDTKKYQAVGYVLVSFILVALSVRSIVRNIDWQTQDNLWLATGKTSPSDPKTHNNLGDVYARRGDWKKSAEEFATAIRINPKYPDAYYNLGNLYRTLKKYDEAMPLFERTLALNPNVWQAHQNIAVINFERGDIVGAESHLKKALEISPENSTLHSNLGIVYYQLNKKQEALNEFQLAVQLEPKNENAKAWIQKMLSEK
ncbi:hypothetical protein A3F29_04005 [Candidatus Roizmanbacteria bacterium RIFCSPHIGHO2_12_FULL_33_9]|uniref:Uncharacterized protein n=1 Tax=Candidatus Roizmanbacteria bacterium RIFCSPHIGHO2_12_FULL_33_9 TaxID=1802045 RepID=A0A1F7HG84_9BACT|nr:MAG: hypothetical protein A3F29_04005 [Candidatus Roizmanbacteria bacterium RIFCSPHIGHO2_12_FULL_33_9]